MDILQIEQQVQQASFMDKTRSFVARGALAVGLTLGVGAAVEAVMPVDEAFARNCAAGELPDETNIVSDENGVFHEVDICYDDPEPTPTNPAPVVTAAPAPVATQPQAPKTVVTQAPAPVVTAAPVAPTIAPTTIAETIPTLASTTTLAERTTTTEAAADTTAVPATVVAVTTATIHNSGDDSSNLGLLAILAGLGVFAGVVFWFLRRRGSDD